MERSEKVILYLMFYKMCKTSTYNLREDERLAEKVRKHKCMYNKTDKRYKERDRTIERDKTSSK